MAKTATLTTITSTNNNAATLNANFAALNTALQNTLSRDGSTPNTLSADIDLNSQDLLNVRSINTGLLYIASELVNSVGNLANWAGTWTTATAYETYDIVYVAANNAVYRCLEDHTSGTFATDLAASKWELYLGADIWQEKDANLDDLSGLTLVAGDILYVNSGPNLTRLPKGTNGQLLGLTAGLPAWEDKEKPIESFVIAASDETTALTTGTGKVTFRMPYAFTVTAVRASVTTAPTGAAIQVDINEGGVSILSTVLSIDATEKTSTTAATPAVISDTSLADDAEMTIDIDQVGSTIAGAGLKVTIIGRRT